MAALLLWVGSADAGRRRIVVLDFEGPKAEKFHADVVKLIKKGHTVLSVDKWNEKADELEATAVTDKNIKKVAKKLKIDGVVTGKIEKRRDEYIIRLKLRSGATGELVGNQVQTKADGTRLDAQAQRDIKDELLAAIDELDSNRSGGGDEEEEAEEEDVGSKKKSGFGKKGQMAADEEAEEDPKAAKKRKAEEEKKKKAEEEEAKRLAKEEEVRKKDDEKKRKDDEKKKKAAEAEALATKAAAKKRAQAEDEEEDEDRDRKSRKRKASSDDEDEEDEGIEDSADIDSGEGRDLSPAGRAFDVVVGMSFVARTLKFEYQADLGKPPPGYKQSVPVAGGLLDLTVYPMSFGNSKGIIRGIGLNVMYDQVLVINSQKRYANAMGMQQIANLKTTENRWAVGPVLRYPMGKVVLGGSLTYGRQQFTVEQTLPNNDPTDIPSVSYTMFTPAAFVKYPVTPKINLNADLAFHAITDTGQIQSSGMTGYGAATVTAYELEAGGDYMVKKNIFARASVRYQSIGIKFKGDPTSQSNMRDSDPEQDVSGAKDTYFGGSITVGYVY